MKQMMKHVISLVALLAMLVSMFSVCVIPAAALDEYEILLAEAYVVNPAWGDKVDGDPISFDFQGEEVTMPAHTIFNSAYHFSSYDDAYAQAEKDGVTNPVILLTAGTYTKTINIKGAVRLLGAYAGVDPNVKSNDKNVAWTNKRNDLTKETVISCNVDVNVSTGSNNLVLDGLTFANGGAFADHHRDKGASEITIKNTVFNKAGNETTLYYALYLRSANHDRTLKLQNLYITGQNTVGADNGPIVGFICPYFVKLYADNVAYVENKVGFLASTWFTAGKAPVIEITGSCFYNAKATTPVGHIISMDNQATDYNKTITKEVSQRPTATLKLDGNIFYNASATTSAKNAKVKGGVIHFQFVNNGSVYNVQNNYFYAKDGTGFMDSEFLINASVSDMTSCMVVENNWLIGAYKVPDLTGSFNQTYINMSKNYFSRTSGDVITQPLYMSGDNHRLIRTEFWVDMELKTRNTDWDIMTTDWSMSWVDNTEYAVEIFFYTENGASTSIPIKFSGVHSELETQLYSSAVLDSDGVILSVSNPISSITNSMLNKDLYAPTTFYLQVTDPENPDFAPIYILKVSNCGDTADLINFSETFPEHFMYHPVAERLSKGTQVPYRWRNQIFLMTAGENLFASATEAITYGYSLGIEIPTVCIPAGIYQNELILPGSCTILGEQYGINPNVKPYEYLTQDKFETSMWTLNPLRANTDKETLFTAPIRVAEDADDYIITIDGIMMGVGCSYVDDYARHSDNVTILKNVFALNAGGGNDRNGTSNIYLFNFNKAFGPLSDRCTFYLYDSRVDGLYKKNVFGPYYEKLVIDGSYFAHLTGGSYFYRGMQSRDIADPYYSMTNCYSYDNDGEGQTSIYMIYTNDTGGNLAVKENIIYNFDGNVFHDAFQQGYAAMEIIFTGNNMTFYFTNNTYKNPDNDGLIAMTSNSRFRGNCHQEDCSEIIVLKGNRLIRKNRVIGTQGTGYGTMFDWSGNFWSEAVNDPGLEPSKLETMKPSETVDGFTYEQCTRYKIDYTYLDWDMTIRSDVVENKGAQLNLTKGMFNTGEITTENVGGTMMKVFRDKVSADVLTYESPALAGEFDTIRYFSDAACTKQITDLNLSSSINEFYGVVYPYGYSAANPSSAIRFKLIIERSVGTAADLLFIDGGLIDKSTKAVTYEISNTIPFFYISNIVVNVSTGATYKFYTDDACTKAAASAYLTSLGSGVPPLYLKVTSEDGNTFNVYRVTVSSVVPGTCSTAGVSKVDGMIDQPNNVFYAEIPSENSSVTFNPIPYFESKIVVRNGKSAIAPNSDGSYTFDMGDAETVELKMTATSQNGSNTRDYTLKFKKVVSNKAELYSVENATFLSTGYSMSLGNSALVENIKASVTPGATYKLYEDYEGTKPLDFPIILTESSKVVYVKVTSANGINSSVTRLTLHTSTVYPTKVKFKGTVGKTDYAAYSSGKKDFNLYLPANAKTVSLKAVFDKVKDLEVKYYADPYRQIEIDPSKVELSQKVTRIYFTIPDTIYEIEVYPHPDQFPTTESVNLVGENGVIKIMSDQSAVKYSDASKIASWAKPYVDYLNNDKHGIFVGDQDKKLNASSNITRNEISVVATRVMGLDVSKYADVELNFDDSVANWAKPYIRAAVGAGFVNGILDTNTGKTYFKGDAYATREQVIKILVCICMANEGIVEDGATYYQSHKNNVDLTYNNFDFEDESKVSSWAVPYIHLAVGKYQLVNGSLNNGKLYLNPKANVTRAEVIKMVACYMGY